MSPLAFQMDKYGRELQGLREAQSVLEDLIAFLDELERKYGEVATIGGMESSAVSTLFDKVAKWARVASFVGVSISIATTLAGLEASRVHDTLGHLRSDLQQLAVRIQDLLTRQRLLAAELKRLEEELQEEEQSLYDELQSLKGAAEQFGLSALLYSGPWGALVLSQAWIEGLLPQGAQKNTRNARLSAYIGNYRQTRYPQRKDISSEQD